MTRRSFRVNNLTIIGEPEDLKVALPGLTWEGPPGQPPIPGSVGVPAYTRRLYPDGPPQSVEAHSRRTVALDTRPKLNIMPGNNFYVEMPKTLLGQKGRVYQFTYVGISQDLRDMVFGSKAEGATVRNERGYAFEA